ncbi:hypothetical protein [Maricaulis sp.]|uniref:hypothetical protein n=1 Tax=Maricaulis sp. TaxID=1486257 RepID=UPI003A90827C
MADALDRLSATARSSIDEINANLSVYTGFRDLFVARAGELYAYGTIGGELRGKLDETLKLKIFDPVPMYRGLYVQLISLFERSVASAIIAHVQRIDKTSTRFSDLPEPFRNQYIRSSGGLLGYYGQGSVDGVSFDFDNLLGGLSASFGDGEKKRLVGEVFTTRLGNVTPDRLIRLFEALSLPEPFSDAFGKLAPIQSWTGTRKAREAANESRKRLSAGIERRNQIVHGAIGEAVIEVSDVEQTGEMVFALLEGLILLIRENEFW